MNHCHDCATPLAESEMTCTSCGASVERSTDRVITAPSAFINANIRVGPLRFHRLITLIATLATLALVALGGRYGWDADPDAGLAFVEDNGTAVAINREGQLSASLSGRLPLGQETLSEIQPFMKIADLAAQLCSQLVLI